MTWSNAESFPPPKSANSCGSARNSCLSILRVRNVLRLLLSLMITSRRVLFWKGIIFCIPVDWSSADRLLQALDLLLNQLPTHPDNLPVLQSHMNTYNGLYSLYFEKVHIACASASPEDIHSLIPGIPLTVISLCQYPVGFYVKKENPKNIRGFSDLTRADIIFVNREKGSSRRILLDRTLLSSEISPDSISGYRNELVTDHSTAAAVGWRTGRHSSWRGLCSEKLSGAGFSSCLPGITLPGYADQKSEHPRLSGRSGNLASDLSAGF